MDDVRTFTGTLTADLVLTAARTLKDRRGPLRALVQKLKNQDLAVAQVGPPDLIQRCFLAVGAVSNEESQVAGLLDAAERVLFASDFEIGELRRHIHVDSFHSG
ncbi:MAG: DUF503 family protein [Candidatus Krumholzibacteriota bacterium]